MKTHQTIAGNAYCVTSPNGGTVTDASGSLNKPVEAGDQVHVIAPSGELYCDDDAATIVKANFKRALAALGLLGGGATSGLPDGYLQAYFLEARGGQYIETECLLSGEAGEKIEADCRFEQAGLDRFMLGCVPQKALFPWGVGMYYSPDNNIIFSPSISKLLQKADIVKDLRCVLEVLPTSLTVNGKEQGLSTYGGWSGSYTWEQVAPLVLFGYPPAVGRETTTCAGTIWLVRVWRATQKICEVIPVVSTAGKPCMYDTVSKKSFENKGSGSFIVGFTLGQARKLGKLAPGSSFTISLPSGWQEDAGVVEALAQAEALGCVLPVQEYSEESSAAATYALRRIWVRRMPDAMGGYVDADGTRWLVEWCVDVIGADPESLGYERYRSVEVAADYWGLQPYQYPEDEQLLTKA